MFVLFFSSASFEYLFIAIFHLFLLLNLMPNLVNVGTWTILEGMISFSLLYYMYGPVYLPKPYHQPMFPYFVERLL